MYLRFVKHNGETYTHAIDEAAVAIVTDVERDEDGMPVSELSRWSIRGVLHAADQPGVIAAMRALESAYADDGAAIYLLCDDQATVAHSLTDTDSGVRVVRRPSYPVGEGAELSTYRTFEITVEAEREVESSAGAVLSYSEVLSFQGTGGPENVLLPLRNGLPQLQQVSQRTPCFATQQGEAVGYEDYPQVPRPYWGDPYFDHQAAQTTYHLPKLVGAPNGRRRFREYKITWSYRFQSPTPLRGLPVRRY